MDDIETIIKDFGGVTKMALAIGKRYPARVSDWRRRGSIPSSEWHGIVAAAQSLGITTVTLERLARMHSGGSSKRRSAKSRRAA